MKLGGVNFLPTVAFLILLSWCTWLHFEIRHLKQVITSIGNTDISYSRPERNFNDIPTNNNAVTSAATYPDVPYDVSKPSPPSRKGIKPKDEEKKGLAHNFYGGKGDKPHLGGFTYTPDRKGISENLWRFMLGPIAVRSLIDLGCGMGVSSSYFLNHGVDVLCLEGSTDAIANSRLPKDRIVEHDFSLGPWWPERTYDAVWCVEFVEHVGRQYSQNYMTVMEKAAIVFVTSAGYGGWHHVEIHEKWWWRARMTAQGFVYMDALSEIARNTSRVNISEGDADHLVFGLDVYINPRVASLPQHQHLFGGNGCHKDVMDNRDGGYACTGIDALPKNFESLLDCRKILPTDIQRQNVLWYKLPWVCNPNARFKN